MKSFGIADQFVKTTDREASLNKAQKAVIIQGFV